MKIWFVLSLFLILGSVVIIGAQKDQLNEKNSVIFSLTQQLMWDERAMTSCRQMVNQCIVREQ